MIPFLKWPGGKRWLAPELSRIIQDHLKRRYFEPFLGGGAVFFNLNPSTASLSDVNPELINSYLQVRNNHKEIEKRLKKILVTGKNYYRIRDSKPRNPVQRAVKFLFLNRTAFGGIYRENKEGVFNVPYGGGQRTPGLLWKSDLLETASKILKRKKLIISDFEPVICQAGSGDVVYCDPTYTVAHNNNGFIRYNESNFSWSDQKRLASVAYDAKRRGAFVIISNANHYSIRKLYPKAKKKIFERMSCVSKKVSARRVVFEEIFIIE